MAQIPGPMPGVSGSSTISGYYDTSQVPTKQTQEETELPVTGSVVISGNQPAVPMDSFGLIAMLAQVLMEIRKGARTMRSSEFQAQVAELRSAAEQMRASAKDAHSAAIADGIFTIASGLMTITAGGLMGASKTGMTPAPIKKPGTPNEFITVLPDPQAIASQVFNGVSQLMQGFGTVTKASYDFESKMHDVEKALIEARAKEHEHNNEQAGETFREALELINSLVQAYQTMVGSEHETGRALVTA